jgi:hypothetical protein
LPHELHCQLFVTLEAEHLIRQEDVAAARLDRVWHIEFAGQGGVEQIVPGCRLGLSDLSSPTVCVQDDPEDAEIPAGPVAVRIAVRRIDGGGVR